MTLSPTNARFARLRIRISPILPFVLTVAIAQLHPAQLTAQQAQRRVATNLGIPFDEIIQVRVNEVLLRVPAGYLWPDREARGRLNEKANLGFKFWMPERRYVEAHPYVAIFRPEEPGRAYPKTGTHVVYVNSLRPVREDAPDYLTPEKKFHNLIASAKGSFAFADESYGLVRFWHQDWPYARPEPFTNYRHVSGTEPQILFRCTPPHELRRTRNPGCSGDVYFARDRLGFFVHFSRDEIGNWREIVFSARELFGAWKSAE